MSFTDKIAQEFALLEQNMNGQRETVLYDVRKQALQQFAQLGLPSTRHEEWKYTNIKTKLPETVSLISHPSPSPASFHSFAITGAIQLVFVNGVFSKELSSEGDVHGLTTGSLKAHAHSNKSTVEQRFGKLVKGDEHFSALNTAFAMDGAFIHVQRNAQIEQPIFIVHLFNNAEVFAQSRNLIVVEQGASVKIVEDFQSTGAAVYYNHVSEVFVNANANVNMTKLQTETFNATAVHTLEADVMRDARFDCTTVTLEGKLIRNNVNAKLSGENSSAHLSGLYFAKGDSLFDNHLLVDHTVPNCESYQLYKGILDNESTGVFNGKIFVKEDAQKTNAFQSSKVILLSNDATMNSKPQLEIFADDVKCSHGAAIGQLSEQELFYFLARGIEKRTAKAMLTHAFSYGVLEKIALEDLRDNISDKLRARLSLHA